MTPNAETRSTFADRAYRALLRLYPGAFRERFGDEMVEFFHSRRLAARERGVVAVLRFWIRTIADTIRSVWRERRTSTPVVPRGGSLFGGISANVRDAIRFLRRSPAMSLVIVLLMTLTIGAATSVFSVVNAVLIQPLPFASPDRLVMVWEARAARGTERNVVSGHEFPVWEEENRVFESMAAMAIGGVTLTGAGDPKSVLGVRVTWRFFDVLGARPLLGRGFVPDDDVPGRGQVAVLSEQLWRERFAADRGIVGRKILLDDRPFEVVGVMSDALRFPPSVFGDRVDYWAPIAEPIRNYRGRHYLRVVARLKPQVTLEQAQADMTRVARQLGKELPQLNHDHDARVVRLQGDLVRDSRASLVLLLSAVGCLLLVGCSNVAGLLLARGLERQHEIGVRLAIGATRLGVARQLLIESLLLALCGATLGIAATFWLAGAIPSLIPSKVLVLDRLSVDTTVLAFALATSAATGLLFGIAPALQIRRVNLVTTLQRSGRTLMTRGRPQMRRVLVAGQVALTLVLALAAGLMARGLLALHSVDPGYETHGVLSATVALPNARYPGAVRQRQFFSDLATRTAAIPGVVSMAATNVVPLSGSFSGISVNVEGRPAPPPDQEISARYRIVSTDYFRTMGIPVLAGRVFSSSDARIAVPIIRWFPQQPLPEGFEAPQPPPVAVINAAMARQVWPNEDPIGRRFRIILSPWITVIGVVANTRNESLRDQVRPELYLHDLQEPQAIMSLLVRTAGDPIELAPSVRSAVWDLDRSLAVSSIRTMDDVVGSTFGLPRLTSSVVAAFAAIAIGLMLAGVYGLMAFTTAQRLPELGLRIALGAERPHVLAMMVRQGLGPGAAGIAIGLASAAGLVRVVQSELFGVPPLDPATWITVTALVVISILAACWLPARRAARVDPAIVLRSGT